VEREGSAIEGDVRVDGAKSDIKVESPGLHGHEFSAEDFSEPESVREITVIVVVTASSSSSVITGP